MGRPITRSNSLLQSKNASLQEISAATTAVGVSQNGQTSPSSSSSSKIPFRPRKIRKLTAATKTTTTVVTTIPPSLNATLKPLSHEGEIDLALQHLRHSDPLLAAVIDTHKPPTFESRGPPFLSLARSILYQQLATNAANIIYQRFLTLCGGEAGVVPDNILSITPEKLRGIGVSGRKASYLHDLAGKYRDGSLSDSAIVAMEDDDVLLSSLTAVKGIGVWSVHMFMISTLHRPDVLPVGDLGVRKGVQHLYGLKDLPPPAQMEQVCAKWKPYRSVGSWYMWRLMDAKAALAKAAKKKPT
ncbi:hypothetical protein Tsubulata_914145 [Turnera subulata]|uniref:HhH-GPD domain-containing protein n=1 Tax=Turnera subulata TaxID=218843 RepID=A0A9Q0JSW0_9ROSI|nr:hypothetical protein Tsubulata_914145 [Turnera subulata]